jgi:galactokinase
MNIDDLSKTKILWANYLLGVAAQFKKAGHTLQGVDCVFGGNIPMGAGLSSSAAIENGFSFALNEILNFHVDKMTQVGMAQKAEHEYAGVLCGIMDQFASMHGKKEQAIKLDCRSLDYQHVSINLEGYSIVLCDSKVKHELASSQYNTRRKECETGVKILQQHDTSIQALRDVTIDFLTQYQNEFEPIIYKRCKYVIEENNRVEKAFLALKDNAIQVLGTLMTQSHLGLQKDYEVSCKELDILFDYAQQSEAILGARMMGGGFGGCTINIVKEDKKKLFIDKITTHYKNKTGITLKTYIVEIVNGTSLI